MNGGYSLRNVLLAAPEKVKVTLLAVLGVAAGLRGWDPSLLETAGVGIAIERVLDLLYVAPVRSGQAAQVAQEHEDAKVAEALNGIELGKQLARVRPLRADPAVDVTEAG